MKRLSIIFLTAFLLVMLGNASVFAADIDFTIHCDTTPVSPGGSYSVTIGIDTKGLTVYGLSLTASFNPNHLTATDASPIGIAQGAGNFGKGSIDSGHYAIGINSLDGISGTGDIIKLDFDVNPTLTPPLTTEVAISSDAYACDYYGSGFSVGLAPGTCTITIDSASNTNEDSASPSLSAVPDGDVAPLGSPDGIVNVGDALVALRFALGLETPSQDDSIHGDVAPLDINGQPDPDGNITVGDALVILRKALGLVDWTLQPTAGELIASKTIGTGGGSIDLDDFTLNVPPGLFDADVALELYDLVGYLPFDEDMVTEAFRLEGLPDEYTQILIPNIKYSGTLSDESFIVVGEKVLIPSLSKKGMAYHLFPAADSSNFLTYSPAGGSRSLKSSDYTSRSNSSPNFLDFFGITGWSTYKANENLRSNGTPGHFVIRYPSYWVSRSDIDPLFQYLEEAYTTYENMGFSYGGRTSWPIEVTVMNIPSGEDGLFCKSVWGNNSSTLEFNQQMLNNLSGLRKTAGHEFFHFIQYLYDSRNNISRNNDYFAYTISLHWLNEATAVWAEEKFSSITNYVSPIRSGHEMAPFDGMEAGTDGNIKQAGYHGYGMSAFIKYLVSKYGESIVRDIYLKILDQKHPVEAINLSLNINNNLFMIWEPFLREYVTGTIYNVQKARFTAIKSGLFRIQSDTDRSKTFTENYPDLSAKLFMIRLDYPEIDKAASINLKIDQDVCDITAFKFKDKIQYLDHSSDKNLTIPDIRKLTDEGYDLLVMVTNSNYFSPYTNSKAIKLDITVSLPGTVTVSAAIDKIVADGTTSTLITAVVKDMDGNNVADGTKVSFATTVGTLSATTATTTNGEASITLTSPTTIGSADITASVGKISGSTKVDFVAGPISSLILGLDPDTLPADGSSTSTIEIKASDANGNPVADSSIGIIAAHGTLSAASATTDKNGVATVVYTSPATAPDGGTDTVTANSNNGVTNALPIKIHPPIIISVEPQIGAEGLQVQAMCYIDGTSWAVTPPYRFNFGSDLITSTTPNAFYTFNTEGFYDVYCSLSFFNGIEALSHIVSVCIMEEEPSIGNYFGCHIPQGAISIESPGIFGPTLRFSLDGKTVGPYVTWYDDQKTQLSEFYCYGEDGTYDGYYGKWFSNGVQFEQGSYVNNKKHGAWIMRRENGTRQTVYYYYMGNLNAIQYYDSDGYYLWTDYNP